MDNIKERKLQLFIWSYMADVRYPTHVMCWVSYMTCEETDDGMSETADYREATKNME